VARSEGIQPSCESVSSINWCPVFVAESLQLIRDLHAATVADGEDQAQKGTQLLEIYALEIQMYNETKNFKKLKVRFTQLLVLNYTHTFFRKSITLQTLSGPQFHIPVSLE
jgi:hypothetical protein